MMELFETHRSKVIFILLTYLSVVYYFWSAFNGHFLLTFICVAILTIIAILLLRQVTSDRHRPTTVNVESKAVLISGCDSGFGNLLARRLNSLGFTVFAGCLQPQGKGALELSQASSDRLHIIKLDVTNWEQIQEAKIKVKEVLGSNGLWSIVSNAGISAVGEVEICPISVYKSIMEVNTFGAIQLVQAFLPLVRKSHGRVVFVSSLSGRYTIPAYTAYSMSKCALNSFADGLRREMKQFKVHVSTIEPTIYKTNITSEDHVVKATRKLLDQCPESIKADYGGTEYFDKVLNNIREQVRVRGRDDPNEVVEEMLDAVQSCTPKIRYVPVARVAVRARIIEALPYCIQDWIMMAYQPK